MSAAARAPLAAMAQTVDDRNIWISRRPDAEVAAARPAAGVLAGATVAVKDNVDVAGLPTTAGCPSYTRHPDRTATAVARLEQAGAVVVGKTNLDQFATGLVGTRSPYGAVESPVAPGRIAGGSSSGSAAAVALGWADIGVATDTAGSGRVPAAFCGVVGLKGTRGWVPTTGVVPACPSFDCTTVFARSLDLAVTALRTMAGPDPLDPSSRTRPAVPATSVRRIGIPVTDALAVCDGRTRDRFEDACHIASARGFELVEVDLGAYLAAGQLLYGGAFVAERTASVGDFLAEEPEGADSTVAAIIAGGNRWTATDLAADRARLDRLRVEAAAVWDAADAVLLPTAPFHPAIAEVAADPLDLNRRLGAYVTGCNLVDWCGAALPLPTDDGLPFGVQLLGPAWSDPAIWAAAGLLLGVDPGPVGVNEIPARIPLAVCGAHLEGEPLNHQLVDRGARLEQVTATSPDYRMVALGGAVPKPGLHRVRTGGGAVEVEVWSLEPAAFGCVVAQVPSPLAIGQVELTDGSTVAGFLCDALVAADAPDITATGGWRAWRAQP